jgi:hypothetical protein
MNSKIKNVHFAKWACKKIGKKKPFMKQFTRWKSRDLLRWTLGENFPKSPAFAQLLYDIHLYTGQEYTSLLAEAHQSLIKDFKEHEFEQTRIREDFRTKTKSD